jgi:perosamine synthetase
MVIDGAAPRPGDGDFIPLSVPEVGGREWDYVKECLDTGWISSVGAFVERFEAAAAQATGAAHAVATVNGTAALHMALMVAGVEAGDEVLVPDLTFIASANAVRYLGAHPVFVDVDPVHGQMDPAQVESFLASRCVRRGGSLCNRGSGRRVKALLPVDVLGHPADLDPLLALAEAHGLELVEDATESLGARYRDRPVGGRAPVACLSFNGNKLISTGGGGMLLTSRDDWARRAKYLTTQAKDDPVEFVHGEVGYNYRLTNVLAAIGVAQLERLDAFVARKRAIADRYREALADLPGLLPMAEAPWAYSTFWMYTVQVDPARYGRDSRSLLRFLDERRIQARPLWQPMHLSPAHRDCEAWRCRETVRLNAASLSLPCSVGLTDAQQDRVIAALREAAGG